MQIGPPPPTVADLQPVRPAHGASNQEAMRKFQSVAPMDEVAISAHAKSLRQEDDEAAMLKSKSRYGMALRDMNTMEALDKKRMDNQTLTSGIKLLRADNVLDEFTLDSRLIQDSVFEYAVSQARSLKSDAMQSKGTGDSINIAIHKADADPSLMEMSESRKTFELNHNLDLHIRQTKSNGDSGPEIDQLGFKDFGKDTDTRLQEANANQPNSPNANVAMALKRYAEVAQSQEI